MWPIFFAMTAQEQAAVLRLLNQAHRHIEDRYSPDGYNIGANIGGPAGSRVHVHLHLIPKDAKRE